MKAGGAVAQAAAKKWGKEDSSPTSMPLDGIARQPGADVHAGARPVSEAARELALRGRGPLCGEAAIELAQPGFTDRNLDWPNWAAAAEALSRVLVTDALDDGAEPPRWLQNTFQDLDEKYGPKIRTRNITGSMPGPTWARCPAASRTARGP